jgi:DNA mismatch repair protein MutL
VCQAVDFLHVNVYPPGKADMIKVLDKDTVARIAAGEVVERPAAVVKELVENAIDSGATEIAVEARGGGVGVIQVSDNGSGIAPEELEIAFQRHATSKLSGTADLDSISTLGFRGEALPSIAAVAEVEMISCPAGKSGAFISFVDGKVVGKGSRARSTGTTVTVRNLFRSVPARLKFLRSTATENGHIANIVSQYALAYPEIKFTLAMDGRPTVSTTGSGRLLDGVLSIYGLDIARSMIEIKPDVTRMGDARRIAVGGMIGAPHVARANRDYLSFFVNRRWISGRLLAKAVEDAYHGLLTVGRHPVAVINIELPGGEVDVNIHPAKTEVRFQNDSQVFGAVQKTVRSTLVEMVPVPVIQQPMATYSTPPAAAPPPRYSVPGWQASPPGAPQVPLAEPADFDGRSNTPLPWDSLPALRLLGQVAASYIVAEGPDGIYLIDQHAAHERIMFEKVEKQRAAKGVEVQGLLEPVTFEATPRQDALMKSHREELADFGFSVEPFGGTTYLVRAAPAGLDGKECLAALREMFDSPGEVAGWRERTAQTVACHSAVRAGKVLSHEEMRQLLRALEQTSIPHTCPHGRPTMTRISLAQLEKEFRRT